MKHQKKINLWIRVSIITLILFLLVTGFFLGTVLSKGNECKQNPLVYGAKEISELNGAEFSCSCYFMGNKFEPLGFDSEEVYLLDDEPLGFDSEEVHIDNLCLNEFC